jgi:hypothetical protein
VGIDYRVVSAIETLFLLCGAALLSSVESSAASKNDKLKFYIPEGPPPVPTE